jgi:hypothetical protein
MFRTALLMAEMKHKYRILFEEPEGNKLLEGTYRII